MLLLRKKSSPFRGYQDKNSFLSPLLPFSLVVWPQKPKKKPFDQKGIKWATETSDFFMRMQKRDNKDIHQERESEEGRNRCSSW